MAAGRCNCGQASAAHEPRFYRSNPIDGSVGISIYQQVISFSVYGFASRVQEENLLVEVSENAGVYYVPAFSNGSFVAPFDGPYSDVDYHRAISHQFICKIHKTTPWADNNEIRVRVTAKDEYGNDATKAAAVVW